MAQEQDKKTSGTSRRGFASMSREKQKEIASRGGKAAHEKGTAHEFTSDEARAAGRLGGQATQKKRRETDTEEDREMNAGFLDNAA